MKKIFTALLLLVGLNSFSQTTGYFRYDSVRFEKVGGNSELIILNSTRNVTGGVLTNLGNGRTGFVTPSGGGSGGLSGGNLGAGFRIYYPPSQGVRTLFNTYGINWDSTLNANGLTPVLDTTLISTRGWRQKGMDSLGAIKQPLDADLTTIAGLTATTDNFIQSKAGAWASRTIAQVKSDLGLTGTNSGDQTISLTGAATGSGTGAIAVTLSSVISAGSCTSCNLTYGADGRITVAANGTGGGASITVGTSGITGGTSTRVPFNDGGVYQEDAGLSYNKTTDALSVSGSVRLPNAQIFSTASDGIAIGNGAAGTNGGGTATNWIAIGTNAGRDLLSGSSNITIGKVSGMRTTTGDSNVFLGANTDTETGFYNTLLGHEIFQAGTTNTGNTSVGYRSYANGTTGTYNTTVGFQSFVQGTTGTDNTGIGESTGYGVTTGSNNFFAGSWAGAYLGNVSNRGVIQTGNQGGLGVGTLIFDFTNKRAAVAFQQDYAIAEAFEVNGNIKAGIAGTTAGRLKLAGSTSGVITLQTAAAAGTYTLTLPTTDGNSSEFLQTDGSGNLTWATGGGGSAGGSNTQVQYNNAGSFGGDAGMTYVAASDALTVTGSGTFASVKVWNGNNAAETTNTAVGNQAANAVTSAASLTAVGYRSAFVNTSGSQITAIGYQALSSNTTGDYNTAVGSNALRDNVTGSNNTAIGIQALILNTGSSNTAGGYTAMISNVGGGQNTAWGFQALMGNTSGNTNTGVGYNAGYTNTTGSNNTYLGYGAAGNTTQSGNTVIGAQVTIGAVSNNIAIGNGTGAIKAQHDATNWTFTATNSIFTGSVSSGVAGSSIGSFKLSGNTSGTISVNPQAAAGTYNFNLPTTAGTSGYLLTSGGGAGTAMTWTDPATLGGSGTVTSFTATDGNGFDFSVANSTTTPTLTATTNLGNTQVMYSNSGAVAGSNDFTYGSGFLTLGLNSTSTGKLQLTGTTSGGILIQPQDAAGTYNFNLPTSAGTSGYLLTSGGGGTTAMTWTDPSTLGGATVGTYTPTITNGSNVSSSSNISVRYIKNGTQVTVIGTISVTATASGANTVVSISLPAGATSNFGASADASGPVVEAGGLGGVCTADATNDILTLTYTSGSTSARSISFSISYTII